jgi:hypothetical protein
MTVSDDLTVTPDEPLADFSQNVQNISRDFTVATGDLTLKSGWTVVLYIDKPDSIALNDVGITVGITVFTSNAQYYKEVNVEAAQ